MSIWGEFEKTSWVASRAVSTGRRRSARQGAYDGRSSRGRCGNSRPLPPEQHRRVHHRMDPRAVHTAATNSARTVRVQVITPPAALTREGQKQLVKEITEIVTKVS